MSNENTKIPYFYIIQHIPSGKMYAGSKYGKDSNPEKLLHPNGYLTSSNIIHKIIDRDGLSSFQILRIDTYCDGIHPLNYETIFLEINNCAKSDSWFNCHNNTLSSYHSIEYKSNMMSKYGVDHNSKIDSVKKSKIIKSLSKYGVSNISESIDIKEKKLQTCLSNFGVDYPMQSELVRQKSKQTSILKYGVEHPTQTQLVKDKIINTNMIKRGVSYCQQDPDVREKSKQTSILKYGVSYYFQSDEFLSKMKSRKMSCPHCGKTLDPGNYKQWHGDKCKSLINFNI